MKDAKMFSVALEFYQGGHRVPTLHFQQGYPPTVEGWSYWHNSP